MDSALFMEKSNLLAHRLTECRRKKTLLARRHKRTKEIVRTEQLIGHRITCNDGDFVGAFRQNVIRVIGNCGGEHEPDEYDPMGSGVLLLA